MKTELPARTKHLESRISLIVDAILHGTCKRATKIILFGSYARGDWVEDVYVENNATYSYQSDLDILVLLNKSKYSDSFALKIQTSIENQLEKKT